MTSSQDKERRIVGTWRVFALEALIEDLQHMQEHTVSRQYSSTCIRSAIDVIHKLLEKSSASSSCAATMPRYLVYSYDKGKTNPHFTDMPQVFDGTDVECTVVVDLWNGKRQAFGEWQDVQRLRCNSSAVPESGQINAAGQVPNVEARPNYGGSAGQSRDEQSSATRLKAETPATAAPLSARAEPVTLPKDRGTDAAWDMVVEALTKAYGSEDWLSKAHTGAGAAVLAIKELASLSSTTPSDAADLLNWIASEYIKLDPFDMPTGQGDADVGWRFSQYHQSKPHERVIYEHFKDDLPAAIRAARSATEASKP